MSGSRSKIRTVVEPGLLMQLQAAATRVDRRAIPAMEASESADAPGADVETGALRQGGPRPDRSSWGQGVAHTRRQVRTTLSVPDWVGEKARRLVMAITVSEQRDASLGATLGMALDLLERELRSRGVGIPEREVALRTGPRHR